MEPAMTEYTKCLKVYMENEDLESTKTKSQAVWTALKSSAMSMKSLLPTLEPYLSDAKEVRQVRALSLLAKSVKHRSDLAWTLDPSELISLLEFFASMVKEPLAGVYGLKGVALVLEAFPGPVPTEACDSIMGLFSGLHAASYDEKGRRYILSSYVKLYEKASVAREDRGDYLASWLKAFKGENSHVNVKMMLEHTLRLLGEMKPAAVEKNADEAFRVIAMYFPVRIAKQGKEFVELQKAISVLLISCMTASPLFIPQLFPFLTGFDSLSDLAM